MSTALSFEALRHPYDRPRRSPSGEIGVNRTGRLLRLSFGPLKVAKTHTNQTKLLPARKIHLLAQRKRNTGQFLAGRWRRARRVAAGEGMLNSLSSV